MKLASLSTVVAYASIATARAPFNASYVENGHPLLRRWYGVKSLDASTDTSDPDSPNVYPWPTTCTSPQYIQPIRYCFKDKRSAKNLNEVVLAPAIAMWAQAMSVTAMRMELAPSTGGDPEVVCSNERLAGERDALVVSDETRDDDPDFNKGSGCQTATTIGYRYNDNRPYRHTLRFCDLDPANIANTKDESIRSPDRAKYLWFQPKYINGYDQARQLATENADYDFEDSDTVDFRMKLICADYSFAKKYFPNVIEHIPGNSFDDPDWKQAGEDSIWDTYQLSDEFDYNSIMIYDGDLGSKAGKKVLRRKDNNEKVWMGGGVDGDLSKTKVSEGDIARIAKLYDAHTPECTAAQKGTTWGPVNVKIRDLDFTVPPPRKKDEL